MKKDCSQEEAGSLQYKPGLAKDPHTGRWVDAQTMAKIRLAHSSQWNASKGVVSTPETAYEDNSVDTEDAYIIHNKEAK